LPALIDLESSSLRVSVLDPLGHPGRFGSRYVSGGYIWQVADRELGPLLTGPAYPDPEPPPFDGQGVPEVFETALGEHHARVGDEVHVIGVGNVLRESPNRPFHVRDNPTVTSRLEWRYSRTNRSFEATATADFGEFGYTLTRSIELDDRALISTTLLSNEGVAKIPVRWFAHPFFPFGGSKCCRLSLEAALPEGGAFHLRHDDFIMRNGNVAWHSGHYCVPRVALGGPLSVEQYHPALGAIEVECQFPLGWLALWSNDRTFSFEPFFQTILLPGAKARWSMRYRF
jgi:hypothetical protein